MPQCESDIAKLTDIFLVPFMARISKLRIRNPLFCTALS